MRYLSISRDFCPSHNPAHCSMKLARKEDELAAEEERRHEEEKRRKRKEKDVRDRRGY